MGTSGRRGYEHTVLLVALLSACDSPPPVFVDATLDTLTEGISIDAPPPLCTPAATPVSTTTLTEGLSFTSSRSTMRAVKMFAADGVEHDILATEGNVDTTAEADFAVVIPRVAGTRYSNPVLAANGQDMILLRYDPSPQRIVRASRIAAGTWSSPEALVLFELGGSLPFALPTDVIPSAPTATVPRRMMLSTPSTLYEFVELNATTWVLERRYSAVFTGISFLGDASLSEDGRRLVFKGRYPGGGGIDEQTGFYVDRPGLDDMFAGTPTAIIPPVAFGYVERPTLSADCRYYTYSMPLFSVPETGTIELVTFP